MCKTLITIGVAAVSVFSAAALSVDDYCSVANNAPKGIKEMRPLNDGETFAAISDDGNAIEVFSYRTGERKNVLFSLDEVKGDLKIDSFDGYELSSNEKKILIWNNTHKIYRHSFTADYFVYDILRKTLRRVSPEGQQRCATISHDGRSVAYMHGNNLYISNLEYESYKAITDDGKSGKVIYGAPDWGYEEEFGVLNTIRWSPDDSVLAFLRFDESEVPVYSFDEYGVYNPDKPLGNLYPKEYSYKYALAGFPNSTVEVYAYNIDSGISKKMDLPISDGYVPSVEFDATGANLMAMVVNRDQNILQLFKVNVGSTVAKLLITEKSNAWLSPSTYRMVKYYGDSFVFASERSGYRHLYEYDYNGNLRRQLTQGDWNVTDYYGRSRTGIHFFQNTQKGSINRNVASLSAGKITLLNNREGTENASFSRNMDYYVRKYSNASTPPQYSICNSTGKVLKNLELNEEYKAKYASASHKEFLKVKNAEGIEMEAYMIKPADFDSSQRYPMMMYQYNGPDSQLVLNEWSMDGTYYIASRGYIVCAVDGRGTDNRSRQWAECVYKHLGRYETADQLAGAAYFASLPFIDGDKTSCFGWSYGGYMTLMELSDPQCRFKAGIAMAAVSDWRFYDSIYTERYMLTPGQNESGYNEASALFRTDNLKAKLLLMSGTSDDNVHYFNTLRYASKLNFENTLYDMMLFPGREHSMRDGNARALLYRKIVEFLDSNVKN